MNTSTNYEEIRSDEVQQSLCKLPDDIMYLIIGKLMAFPANLGSFSAVCKHWHRLMCVAWPKIVHQIRPIALIPVVDPEDRNLFGICNLNGRYVSSVPYGTNRIIGSSFGWLIITDIYQKSVSLFNPLSKSHIRLPPFSLNEPNFLMKGVLSKPIEEEGDTHFDVAITMRPEWWLLSNTVSVTRMIAFLHVDKIDDGLESLRWVYHYCGENPDGILDVNSICGRICMLYSNGNISCYDCNSTHFYGVRKKWDSIGLLFKTLNGRDAATTNVYLLESSSSEPLVVIRYNDANDFLVVEFKILSLTNTSDNGMNKKLNKTWNWTENNDNDLEMRRQEEDLLNWTEIKTLDDDVLFISKIASICVQAASKQHQHAGSIYLETNFSVYDMDQICITLFPNRDVNDTNSDVSNTKRCAGPPFWLPYDLKFSSIGYK